MSDRDEAVVPLEEIRRVIERVLGNPTGLRVQFIDRSGRSEKITLLFDNGGTVTISANTRRPGESRRALIAFIERCGQIGREVHAKLLASKEGRDGH